MYTTSREHQDSIVTLLNAASVQHQHKHGHSISSASAQLQHNPNSARLQRSFSTASARSQLSFSTGSTKRQHSVSSIHRAPGQQHLNISTASTSINTGSRQQQDSLKSACSQCQQASVTVKLRANTASRLHRYMKVGTMQ